MSITFHFDNFIIHLIRVREKSNQTSDRVRVKAGVIVPSGLTYSIYSVEQNSFTHTDIHTLKRYPFQILFLTPSLPMLYLHLMLDFSLKKVDDMEI